MENTPVADTPKILGVMSDLFFSISIMDAVKAHGAKAVFVKDQERALQLIQAGPKMVIFDLNCAGVDTGVLLRALKADPATRDIPTLGFVSHVQTETRRKALEDGCDVVVPRSVFSQNLADLLRSQLTKPV